MRTRTTTSTTARGGGRRAAGSVILVLATFALSVGLVADGGAARGIAADAAPTKRVSHILQFGRRLRGVHLKSTRASENV